MRRAVLVAAAALTLALTSACGQKGALYLPKRGTVVTRPAGSSAPADSGAEATGAAPGSAPAPGSAAPAESASPPGKPDDKKDDDKSKPKH